VDTRRYKYAGALVGGIAAEAMLVGGVMSANAATNGSGGANGTSTTDHHQGAPGETLLTGANAAKARTAALNAVPGGTIQRIETDSGDAAYEAHMTKPDGSDVTVKFDKFLSVTGVEAGMGR
jgi:hypothetical protein